MRQSIRVFLENYEHSINLDDASYNIHFPSSVKRADFLLFDKQVVCEVKEIQTVKVAEKAEKLAIRGDLSGQNFKRDFYNSINNSLSEASKQIKASKEALDLPEALGLVILENAIPNDLSILTLMDASGRKMKGGLVDVDVVLCLDRVNTFSRSDKKPVNPSQSVLRDTDRARQLNSLLHPVMEAFCEQSGTPLYKGFSIESGEQAWRIQNGKYQTYKAKFDFKENPPDNLNVAGSL